MDFVFAPAVRKKVPMLISVSGTSGSGKTYSSLLLAAGIAGPKGVVGFLDTENGRGSLYSDSPGIVRALPNGFHKAQMDAPFSPDRYIAAIESAEKSGINVLVIDSTSHEWEGIGGCTEIADKNKLKGMPNWSMAKMAHKRFVNHCLSSTMDIVFCLRARDKVKIAKDDRGREQFIPIGIQPIAEKNFVFEMLLSLMLDEQTHHARAVKIPEPLVHLFTGERLLAKDDGERIREWNEMGRALDPHEQLRKRAKAAAEQGMSSYSAFFADLVPAHKAALKATDHEENKRLAKQADDEAEARHREQDEDGSEPPPPNPEVDAKFFGDVKQEVA